VSFYTAPNLADFFMRLPKICENKKSTVEIKHKTALRQDVTRKPSCTRAFAPKPENEAGTETLVCTWFARSQQRNRSAEPVPSAGVLHDPLEPGFDRSTKKINTATLQPTDPPTHPLDGET